MAIVLGIQVDVGETNEEGGSNVLMRSSKATSIMPDEGTGAEGMWILAQSVLAEVMAAVGDDARTQMQVAERNAKRLEARGEL